MRFLSCIAAVLLAVLPAGCTGDPGDLTSGNQRVPRVLEARLPPRDGRPEVPIRLTDRSGMVVAISVLPSGSWEGLAAAFGEDGIVLEAGRPDLVLVSWTSSRCERRLDIEVRPGLDALLEIETHPTAQAEGCEYGAQEEVLRLQLARPILARDMELVMAIPTFIGP